MASLAAIFSRSGSTAANERTVGRMLNSSPHRGRVSEIIGCGRYAVGVADHPGESATSIKVDGDAVGAFSGILDNLDELGDALGVPQGSRTPASVALAAYRKHGEDFPAAFRGCFSGFVSDGSRLVCFRDQIGFRSLFYRADSTGFYIATEAKQVIAGAGLVPEPDPEVLERIYFHAYDDTMPCALRGVHRLPKATSLVLDEHGARTHRYWDPARVLETAGRLSMQELRTRFDELFTQAVTRMATGSDVVSLSGGIDSTAVAAYAARVRRPNVSRPLGALSAIYPDVPSADELRYIREVADQFGMELHTYVPQAKPLDRVAEWVRICDGPVPTISLSYYEESYGRARDLGYRTVLSGEVAEFLVALDAFLISYLVTHRRLGPAWKQLRARRRRGSSFKSLGRLVALSFVPSPITALRWRNRTNGVPAWIDVRRANQPKVDSLVPPSERWRVMQLSAFGGTALTMEAEELCQDVCGVRTRMPWADVDLWEFFLSLPAETKFPDPQYKSLVRALLRGRVPDIILDRRDKTVFDDAVLQHVDHSDLRALILHSDYRMPGVDYGILESRLANQEKLTVHEFNWLKDLASVHAFVSMVQ